MTRELCRSGKKIKVPGCAANRSVAACRGRYIAFMSGDDVCHRDRIETQLEAYRQAGGGFILSNLNYIDDDGHPIESCHIPKNYYALPAMSQAAIVERFFRQGNFVPVVTGFTDAETLRRVMPFDPLLYQAQDYDLLIRLAKTCPFTFMPRCTVSYRARNGNANLCAPSPTKVVRTHNEIYLIFRRFFDGITPELFREAFRGQLVNPDSRSPLELACEQAFLLMRHPEFSMVRTIGMDRLHDLLLDPEACELLRDRFHYTRANYINDLLNLDSINHLPEFQTYLHVDSGSGYNAVECRQMIANHSDKQFSLTFDLASLPAAKELCWKVAPRHLCRCRLEKVTWRDRSGAEHNLDPATIFANGNREADGGFSFDHLDPSIFFPIEGEVQQLTLQGRWEVMDSVGSLWQSNGRLLDKTVELELTKQREIVLADKLRLCEENLNRVLNSRVWRLMRAMKACVPKRNQLRRAG